MQSRCRITFCLVDDVRLFGLPTPVELKRKRARFSQQGEAAGGLSGSDALGRIDAAGLSIGELSHTEYIPSSFYWGDLP